MEQTYYTTSNIYLAAALLTVGATLDDVDRTDKKHQVFILSGTIDFLAQEKLWYDGTMIGNLSKYKDNLQKLKSKLYAF